MPIWLEHQEKYLHLCKSTKLVPSLPPPILPSSSPLSLSLLSGEKVALFWIAWAFVAEKVGNFKLTDQIFQKVPLLLLLPSPLLLLSLILLSLILTNNI